MDAPPGGSSAGAGGALPGNLGGALAGKSLGDLLSNGLRDLVDSFKQAGQGDAAESWVGHGPNKQIGPCCVSSERTTRSAPVATRSLAAAPVTCRVRGTCCAW